MPASRSRRPSARHGFVAAAAGQQAEPEDVRALLVGVPVERGRQPLQLGRRGVALALRLGVPLDAFGGVVERICQRMASANIFATHRRNAVGLGGLAGLGELAVKRIDVGPGHLGHLLAPDGRPDVAFDRDAVVGLSARPLAADMLLEEAPDQIVDGRGPALGLRSQPAGRRPGRSAA